MLEERFCNINLRAPLVLRPILLRASSGQWFGPALEVETTESIPSVSKSHWTYFYYPYLNFRAATFCSRAALKPADKPQIHWRKGWLGNPSNITGFTR